jgi:proteasome lid subunit RPN8/RPN11
MEELRFAAVDGFHRLVHGGVEIGGVLFGVRDPDGLKILAHRELACEYVFGPSFTLSENDRRTLEELLASPGSDSQLSGMQPVGWYQSHTRSEILLSEEELQFYQRYFPEIWQIALVLRPHRFDPVRAGFFHREPDGSVQAAASRLEFYIEPAAVKPVQRLPEDRAPEERQPRPPAVPAEPHQEPEPPTSPAPPAVSRNSRRRLAWSAAAIAAALAAVLLWNVRSRPHADLSLRVLDVGGQLRINWNHSSRVIQDGQSGAIEIVDGLSKVYNELSQEDLRSGSVTYLRTTGNVQVSLAVRGADQATQTEIIHFSGPPVTAAAKKAEVAEVLEEKAVDRPSNPAPRQVPVATISIPPAPAPPAPAPARRLLVLPSGGVPHTAEHLLPAPPTIVPDTTPVMATLIPRLPGPAPVKPTPADQGPTTGKIIWTGKLGRSGTIQILGSQASQGHLTGGLPGTPVRVKVFRSEMTPEGVRIFAADPESVGAPEAPGAQNGWNRTVYVLNPRKAGEVSILEAPGPHNAWNRLILRAERGDHSIIVLRWERLPAEASVAAAGNQ